MVRLAEFIGLLVLAVLLAGGLFYWIVFRPVKSVIREERQSLDDEADARRPPDLDELTRPLRPRPKTRRH